MPDSSSVPVIWIVLAAIAAVVIGVIVLYNQLVAMDVRCDNAWSDMTPPAHRCGSRGRTWGTPRSSRSGCPGRPTPCGRS
jgi:hypothetical protein